MLSGLRVQLAVATLLLLAQLGLPMSHGLAFAAVDRAAPAASLVAPGADLLSPLDADRHGGPTHDPNLCPICLALSQVRSAVDRVPALAPLHVVSTRIGPSWSPWVALSRGVELASAPPRAPPLRSLPLV